MVLACCNSLYRHILMATPATRALCFDAFCLRTHKWAGAQNLVAGSHIDKLMMSPYRMHPYMDALLDIYMLVQYDIITVL